MVQKKADFQIFSLDHNTKSEYEFGEISELSSEKMSKRFEYSLLNAGDQDTVTILTNDVSEIGFFAKAEGLKIVEQKPGEVPFDWIKWPAIAALAAGASILAEMLQEFKSLVRRNIRVVFLRKREDDEE